MSIRSLILGMILVCPGSRAIQDTHLQEYRPENTVFFFDLHDVVLKRDGKELFKSTIGNLPLFFKRFPADLKKEYTALRKRGANGQEYEALFNKYHFHKLARLVREISNAQKINNDTVAVIKELKARGFTVCIASNIGSKNYQELLDIPASIARNSKQYKTRKKVRDALLLFDDALVVDYDDPEAVAKPHPDYFRKLRANLSSDMHIIFIDDNKDNIMSAQSTGISALQFTSAKKLRHDLALLGIL